MKKFAKMSLVAAVVVASTSAFAGNLAEAVQNADISGSMVYRLNSYENSANTNQTNTNYYKVAVNISSKVNDDLKANIGIVAGNGDGMVGLNAGTTGDADAAVSLVKANFSYTGIANTTLIAGKQGIPTPWTKATDADGNINTGTGLLALVNAGPVTIAGAIFNQITDAYSGSNPLNGVVGANGQDLGTLGVMANIGPVSLDAWYASLANTFETYTIGAKATIDAGEAAVTVDARYTDLETEAGVDNSLAKIKVSAKAGIFNAYVGYGVTGEDGGLVGLQSATEKTGMIGWNVNLAQKADSELFMIGAGAQVISQLNVALKYNNLDRGNSASDEEEIYTEIKWSPSKNFYTYLRAGQYEVGSVDTNRLRIQAQYSF